MPKWAKWLIGSLLFFIIAGAVTVTVLLGYVKPYETAENTMPQQGEMLLRRQPDDTIHITWSQGINAHGYVIRMLDPAGADPENGIDGTVLYEADVGDITEHLLRNLPEKDLIIQVGSYCHYQFLFPQEQRTRFGERTLEIRGVFTMPAICDLSTSADPETDVVSVNFSLAPNTTARMYRVGSDGNLTLMQTLTQGETSLRFCETGDLPMPGHGEQYTFTFDAWTKFDGYVYYGLPTERFSVVREDLLGTLLQLQCEDLGNNRFRLSWSETKGDGYTVSLLDPVTEQWLTVLESEKDGSRVCETGHLGRYGTYTFRVSAASELVQPEEVTVTTGASVVYSTVWPIKDLEVYTAADRAEVAATASVGKALCVLDVQDGLFYVRVGNTYGYIDSNYCMINLPDMIGDICLYNITNSYESIYMVHQFEIPEVTGEVIKGYEKVELSKGKYLVPLLYPAALKLEKAAFAAIDQGYKLLIYDSYRPNKATLDIYDLAKKIMDDPIPEKPYRGEMPEDMPVMPTLPEDAEGAEDEEPPVLTYQMLMTDNGRYSLANFLAKGGSRHNQGVALDLTLTKNGKELEMQTAIHDLSWYSEPKKNNKNAKLLKSIMEGAGFGGLTSEWWHFQDNDAKKNFEPPYMKNGVTPEGWVADDHGWRYRQENGKFYTDCEKTIDDVTYRFDEKGYVIEP